MTEQASRGSVVRRPLVAEFINFSDVVQPNACQKHINMQLPDK